MAYDVIAVTNRYTFLRKYLFMYVTPNYILVHSWKLRSKYTYKCIYMCCF